MTDSEGDSSSNGEADNDELHDGVALEMPSVGTEGGGEGQQGGAIMQKLELTDHAPTTSFRESGIQRTRLPARQTQPRSSSAPVGTPSS